MKVLLVNTSERVGGAAIAAHRLLEALKKNGVSAKMLVRDRQSEQMSVVNVRTSWMLPVKFLWERLIIFLSNGMTRKSLWTVDLGTTGVDVTHMNEFRDADVVHIHWVNQSFLSLRQLERIMASGKRIVVTLHDMWHFTGICHYAGDCKKYTDECSHCPLMGKRLLDIMPDWASRAYARKKNMYASTHVTFVGCSQWITDLAASSALTQGSRVVHIPNAIDTEQFAPFEDKTGLRRILNLPSDKKLVLFSSQRITDPRKGFSLLIKALNILSKTHPDVELVVVGGDAGSAVQEAGLKVHAVSYVDSEDEMVRLYNAADIYVTPSLQDNLPNTIVEALACGTPCVGFRVGGIPEMIDHRQTGYVANYRDAQDMAEGIAWCLSDENHMRLSRQARQKALETYNEKRIAQLYSEIYENA